MQPCMRTLGGTIVLPAAPIDIPTEVLQWPEPMETDVQGCDQLLFMSIDDSAEELPGASTSVHTNHPENLEEPKSSQGRGSVHPSTKPGENNK